MRNINIFFRGLIIALFIFGVGVEILSRAMWYRLFYKKKYYELLREIDAI